MAIMEMAAMDRRALLQRVGMLIGATTALSACDMAGGTGGASFAMSDKQRELLIAISDTIIPETDTVGAVTAGVPKLVEQLLVEWAAPETRDGILASMDKIAALGNGGNFAALSPEQRLAALDEFDVAATAPPPPAENGGDAPAGRGPRVSDEGYAKLKQVIVLLYYYSEPAVAQELPYAHDPGRWDPSVPVTEDTRPELSISGF